MKKFISFEVLFLAILSLAATAQAQGTGGITIIKPTEITPIEDGTFTATGCAYPWMDAPETFATSDQDMLTHAEENCPSRVVTMLNSPQHFLGNCRGFPQRPYSRAVFNCMPVPETKNG